MKTAEELFWGSIPEDAVLARVEIEPGRIRLHFHAGEELTIRGHGLTWEVARPAPADRPIWECTPYRRQLARDLRDQARLDGVPLFVDGRGRFVLQDNLSDPGYVHAHVFDLYGPEPYTEHLVDVRPGQPDEPPQGARRRARAWRKRLKSWE